MSYTVHLISLRVKKKIRKITISIYVSIQLTGTPGVSPDVERMFSAVDTDRSGKITPKELQQALQNGKGQNFSDRCCQLLVCT